MYQNALENVKEALRMGPLPVSELSKRAGYCEATTEKALRKLMQARHVVIVSQRRGKRGWVPRQYALREWGAFDPVNVAIIERELGITLVTLKALPWRATRPLTRLRWAFVLRLLDLGATYDDVAQATGLSHSMVKKISQRHTKDKTNAEGH